MRLILSGGGSPEKVIPIDGLFVSQIDTEQTVLYIPVAMERHMFSYDECLEWFRKTYGPYGIKYIEMCTDLKSANLRGKQYTAIFVGGGNTFKLLKEIKESGFDLELARYLSNNGLLYGGSAGAMICGKTIQPASYLDINNLELADLTGLDLVGGKDIFCHYNDGKSENDFIANCLNDLFVLYEESGLFIHDGKVEGVGKKFLSKNDIVGC